MLSQRQYIATNISIIIISVSNNWYIGEYNNYRGIYFYSGENMVAPNSRQVSEAQLYSKIKQICTYNFWQKMLPRK